MKRTETKRVFPMHFWGNYECVQPFDARRMHKRLSGQDCEDREGRTDISMQVKIYTDGAARGNRTDREDMERFLNM